MSNRKISKVYASLADWRSFQFKLFAEGILVGAFSGFAIVAFRFALELAEHLRSIIYPYLSAGSWIYSILWFLLLLIIAYVIHRIVTFEPMSAGSGIPQVKGTILGIFKMHWGRILIGKMLGGTLAIGAGLSLGREGPSIQMGAVVGQGLSRLLGRTRMEERYLITSGASAGLAAAFNAPLAGVIFSLEELHKNFSSAVLLPTIAAALTADVISQYFFGANPIFHFLGLPILPAKHYGLVILLGIFTGVSAIAFNKALVKTLDYYDKQSWVTGWKKIAVPLMLAGLLGFSLPEILGGGNDLVNTLASVPLELSLLCILLLAKFLFTMISYGSGVPGGIFLPLLVIGALTGAIFGDISIQYGFIDVAYRTNLIILSMAAYLIADLAKTRPIYDELLSRSLAKQGAHTKHGSDKKRMVLEIPVGSGSALEGKLIKEVCWPPSCLLVSIKRGENELVPKGDARMITGDYLFILTDVDHADKLRSLSQ
jgi:H+/Cl- antiporter ClcA